MSPHRRRVRLPAEVWIVASTGLAALLGGVAGLWQSNLSVAVPALTAGAALSAWAVHRQLKTPQPSPPPPSRPTPVDVGVWNVPRAADTFTGRQAELTMLAESLASVDRIGVVALHGLGGAGKTQLALRYAAGQAATGAVEVGWFINASTRGYVLDALAALGVALGQPPIAEVETAAGDALRVLGRRGRWLLIYFLPK